MNGHGAVVGTTVPLHDSHPHATLWRWKMPQDLNPPDEESNADGVNRFLTVVGISRPIAGGEWQATRWQDGVATRLPTLGGSFSHAYAINNAGQIVGDSALVGDIGDHVVRWDSGLAADLGTLGEVRTSLAWGIGNDGTVVGYSFTTADNHVKGRRAAMWRDGVAIDLNTLLDDATRAAGWVLLEARAINDDGVIVGAAKNALTGKERAFRLTPP